MPAEPTALSTVPPSEPPADTDYDAICAAVTATARGRWFLDEFAKRNRNTDTTEVLAAIARMEATVVGERTQQASREAHQEVQIELLEMARTIAQARAEVAESRPAPTQQGAAESTNTISPDVAAAAERLRQIAWTMRACGIELPASDQIGRIAETILSADALRGLGEQRAQKLTEALLYLEDRIDRMLDGHRTAASGAEADPAAETVQPAPNRPDRDPPLATAAVAMIAAAMRANAEQTAEPAPLPSATAVTTPSEGTVPATADIAEYPMDDDVVLTVADSAVAPAAAASLAAEPFTVEPVMAETIEPAPAADSELTERDDDGATAQDERVEFEFEPLLPAKRQADAAETGFPGLELEPLAIARSDADEAPSEPQAPAAEATPEEQARPEEQAAPAEQETLEEMVPAATSTVDERAAEPLAEAPSTATAAVESAAEADPIALQVDQDLDELATDAPDRSPGDEAAQTPAAPVAAATEREQASYPQLVHTTAREDEPAEFLLEEAPRKVPVSALVASAQASRAQLSDTLAAIESELFGSTRPPTDTSSGSAEASIPAKSVRAPAAQGPLAALMAMSEEERIALFS
jgi:hypothetical protein